jgi:hypothetical protein
MTIPAQIHLTVLELTLIIIVVGSTGFILGMVIP